MVERFVLHVVKIGGNAVDNPSTLASILAAIAKMQEGVILVHGGGGEATTLARRLGLEPVMVEGRRITDAAMLDVVVMVYAGLINKRIVASFAAHGVTAIGLSGPDGDLITASKRTKSKVKYGYVGDITAVDVALLESFLDSGLLPVIAPITHDGKGQLLNTNADTIAAAIASAFARDYRVLLHLCFDQPGVCLVPGDESSVLPVLDAARFRELSASGVITSGMLPKLENGFAALAAGVDSVRLLHADAFASFVAHESEAGTELVE
jgi:acetylglutamate kinase